jgi:inner membrane protein involved in colicin E2 resistance
MNEQTAYNVICIASVAVSAAMLLCLYLAPASGTEIVSVTMLVALLALGAVIYKLSAHDADNVE